MLSPTRGEIWLVEFEPSRGAEITKIRPAVVVSIDETGYLPLRMVVPFTDWKEHYSRYTWFTHFEPRRSNGLSKPSGADAFQCKSVSLERFKKKLGIITGEELKAVVDAIALCIGKSS